LNDGIATTGAEAVAVIDSRVRDVAVIERRIIRIVAVIAVEARVVTVKARVVTVKAKIVKVVRSVRVVEMLRVPQIIQVVQIGRMVIHIQST
jgi:hypothetical protein